MGFVLLLIQGVAEAVRSLLVILGAIRRRASGFLSESLLNACTVNPH